MGGRDGPDSFDCRNLVEENIAAAIDLQIDKTWREPRAIRQSAEGKPCRQIGPRHHRGDLRSFDDDGGISVQASAVKQAVRRDRMPRRMSHRVRVTLFKWRGRSTSVPRNAATRMIRA